VTPNGKTAIGYQDVKKSRGGDTANVDEYALIFNLTTKKFVHKEILDLEDNKERESEDPYKLI
jgi:hypothetical protein